MFKKRFLLIITIILILMILTSCAYLTPLELKKISGPEYLIHTNNINTSADRILEAPFSKQQPAEKYTLSLQAYPVDAGTVNGGGQY